MTLMAVPVVKINCKVGIDRGHSWTVIDEAVLWGLFKTPRSIAALCSSANLSRRVIIASLTRLMRYRLVEIEIRETEAVFRASKYGEDSLKSASGLPTFPQRSWRRVSIAVELLQGSFFRSRELQLYSKGRLKKLRALNPSMRTISVRNADPEFDTQTNLARVTQLAGLGPDEHLATVDARSTIIRDQFMVISSNSGEFTHLPKNAPPELKEQLLELSDAKHSGPSVTVSNPPPDSIKKQIHDQIPCQFNPGDVTIGGSSQRELLRQVFNQAKSKVIIQSTFLDAKQVKLLHDEFRTACRRGIEIVLLLGGEKDQATIDRNFSSVADIQQWISTDTAMRGQVKIHPHSLNSHAKILATDLENGHWIAAVGSCNWLSSPMRATEMTVTLREPQAVADVLSAVRGLVERDGEMTPLAATLAVAVQRLRDLPTTSQPNANVRLISGEEHDALARQASGAPGNQFVMSSHRLGATARTGALLPSMKAASTDAVNPTLIFTRKSGPLKARHVREFIENANEHGVDVLQAGKIPLHAKFLIWGDDDLIVTSLNWASSASGEAAPPAELGVHLSMPGIGNRVIQQLAQFIPELAQNGDVIGH